MKRIISVLICLSVLCAFAGCSDKNPGSSTASGTPAQASAGTVSFPETILDTNEYVIYQNIYYNDQERSYINKQVTKTGTFAVLDDKYNDIKRYYVWGYNDNTKCCDWQWEMIPKDKDNLPPIGSTIEVSGMLKPNDIALDKYLIEDAEITVKKEYEPLDVDVDMTTMGGTLERVQVYSFLTYPEKFEGKKVSVYGRITSGSTIQHPYYNECFTVRFDSDSPVLPTGTNAVVYGTVSGGKLINAIVTKY